MEREPMIEGSSSTTSRSVEISSSREASEAKTPWWISRHQMRLWVLLTAWLVVGLYMFMSRPWGTEQTYYTFVEAIYVMAQIVTTVGYGDYTPAENGGMVFCSLYVLTAVLVLSSIVSAITEAIIKTEDQLIQNALGQVDLKTIKKKISKAHKSLGAVASDAEEDPSADPGAGSQKPSRWGFSVNPKMHPASVGFLRAALIWSVFVLAGVVFFTLYPGEEKEPCQAFYMSVITLTTVGFGDVVPRTPGGKLFATFWMLLGVGAFANMVGKFAAFCMAQDRLRVLDEDTLLDIQHDAFYMKCHPPDGGPPPTVTRADFVLFMMKQMGILDQSVVEQLSTNFDDLDRDTSGYLDQADIREYHERIRQHLNMSTQASRGFLQ